MASEISSSSSDEKDIEVGSSSGHSEEMRTSAGMAAARKVAEKMSCAWGDFDSSCQRESWSRISIQCACVIGAAAMVVILNQLANLIVRFADE